jgi:hypothetical protein
MCDIDVIAPELLAYDESVRLNLVEMGTWIASSPERREISAVA